MITNEGFRDILHIGRHQRPQHYSIMQEMPWQSRPLVKRRHRKVVAERLDPAARRGAGAARRGRRCARAARELQARRRRGGRGLLPVLLSQPGARGPRAKRSCARIMPDAFVTTSSSVVAAVPRVRALHHGGDERLHRAARCATTSRQLDDALREAGVDGDLRIMRSNGGVATPAMVAEQPVLTLLSGLAAGVLGGAWVGALSGRRQADHLRHRRHQRRHRHRHRRRASARPTRARHLDRRLSGAGADDRHPHDRRRRRLDRLCRPRRRLPRRSAQRRRRAGPGRLRPRRHRADRHRRQSSCSAGSTRDNFLGGAMTLDADGARSAWSASWPRELGLSARRDRGGHRSPSSTQHGERHPLAHGAEGHRSARVRAGRLRRRRPAAWRRSGRHARHSGGDRAALSGHHLGGRAAHHRPQIRRHPHAVPGLGRGRPRAPQRRLRGDGRGARRAASPPTASTQRT